VVALRDSIKDMTEEGSESRIIAEERMQQAIVEINKKAARELADLKSEQQEEELTNLRDTLEETEEARQETLQKSKEDYDDWLEHQKEIQQDYADATIMAAQTAADTASMIANDMYEKRADLLDRLKNKLQENADEMTAAEKAALKEQIQNAKQAAKNIANVQKAIAIIDIAIKTAQGVMSVWAQFGAYPPVAAGLSAGVIAMGAVEAAIVAKQKPEFHRGGVVEADLLPGESVLNRQATRQIGEQNINALNNRGSMAFNSPSLGFRIGRIEAREIVRTDLVSGGYISQEIGRQTNSAGQVGRSGSSVLA